MKFAAKVITIVSGVSLITFSGIQLRNKYNMQRYSGSNETHRFRTTRSEGNKNCNFLGSYNQGLFLRNKNTNLIVDGSEELEIIENCNMEANITNSSVKAIGQLNCKLFATSSNIQLHSDKNVNIKAEDAWCLFEKNKNLKYEGRGGANSFLSKFIGNLNGDFQGMDNNVLASNNKNLNVCGDRNRLEVSDTRNHSIRPASNDPIGNVFTVLSSGKDSFQFLVQYVDEAVIKGTKYQLGIFNFEIAESGRQVNVTYHNDDNVTHSVVENVPGKIVIQAEKDNITQKLELKGDRVEALGLNTINIFV